MITIQCNWFYVITMHYNHLVLSRCNPLHLELYDYNICDYMITCMCVILVVYAYMNLVTCV